MKLRRWQMLVSLLIVVLALALTIGVGSVHKQSAHAAGYYSSQIEVDSNANIIAVWISGRNQNGVYTQHYAYPSNQWSTFQFQISGWWWSGQVSVTVATGPSRGTLYTTVPYWYNAGPYYHVWYEAW